MLIGFSSQAFDLDGDLICSREPGSADHTLKRRVSRTRLIGGGVVIDDQGFSAGDSTLVLDIPFTERARTVLSNLVKSHPVVGLSAIEGFFTGVISDVQLGASGDNIRVTYLIEQGG